MRLLRSWPYLLGVGRILLGNHARPGWTVVAAIGDATTADER
ncbi:hypothetical protein [Aeromicrobium choanae]|nr:hypothetical protein [Aeromicrobium choanae]